METSQNDVALLEKAAKHICTFREGLCPMVVEEFSCNGPAPRKPCHGSAGLNCSQNS